MRKANVLFLCTGNSARSQMAEAFLRKYAGDQFEVYSAGLRPSVVNPLTTKVMEEQGFDLSEHYSKDVKQFMGRLDLKYAITVCSHADEHCPHALWSMGKKLHWPFDDPAAATGTEEQKLAKFREIRDQIDHKIQSWLEELETGRHE